MKRTAEEGYSHVTFLRQQPRALHLQHERPVSIHRFKTGVAPLALHRGIARENRIRALAIGGTVDHVHALMSLPAMTSFAKAVQLIKGGSSKWLHHARYQHWLRIVEILKTVGTSSK